jgi:hypothetical protein
MGLILEGVPPRFPHPAAPEVAAPAGATAESSEPSRFGRLLDELGGAIDRGEALLDGATTGAYQTLDAPTLIALQAGIYRYSEAIDLTSKLVERVTSGARTILQAGH